MLPQDLGHPLGGLATVLCYLLRELGLLLGSVAHGCGSLLLLTLGKLGLLTLELFPLLILCHL
jgi:hypothetical protein